MRSRKSAKQEITAIAHWLMKNRPKNHPKVVIELTTIATICRSMGWITLKDTIEDFCGTIDSEVLIKGLTEGID